jgi:ABC-type branched-subunit amino acid transport system substrate-binding protein
MHAAARRSLSSILLTAAAITVNHLYVLGFRALLLGAALAIVPIALLLWFRATRSAVAFGAYLLMNLWIVVGFGLLKGLWGIMLPLYAGTLLASHSSSYPSPTLGAYTYEASGILMFVGAMFVLYYAWRLIEARRADVRGASVAPSTRDAAAFGVAVTVVVALSTVAFAAIDKDRFTPPKKGVVKIGVLVPTAGPYSILGTSFLRAVQMAEADRRDTRYRYQLVVAELGDDPVRARKTIQRVIEDEHVNAIVGGISLFGQVTKPLATRARIPHTCVCTVTSIGDGAYNFTNIPSPEAEASRWVDEAKRRGIGSVAIVSQDYPSINNHVKALRDAIAHSSIRVLYATTLRADRTDFRSLIDSARSARPDVFYVEALEPSLDLLAQQFAEAGVHNLSSVVAPSLSRDPELFEGVWYTDSDLRDPAFRSRFERKYPDTQFATHMMPYAYDDYNLIVDAYESGQNPAVYLRSLTHFEGSAGPISRAPGSGNFQSVPAVWTIRDAKPTLVR